MKDAVKQSQLATVLIALFVTNLAVLTPLHRDVCHCGNALTKSTQALVVAGSVRMVWVAGSSGKDGSLSGHSHVCSARSYRALFDAGVVAPIPSSALQSCAGVAAPTTGLCPSIGHVVRSSSVRAASLRSSAIGSPARAWAEPGRTARPGSVRPGGNGACALFRSAHTHRKSISMGAERAKQVHTPIGLT